MVVISLTFFDSDDYVVKNTIIPCDNIEVAKGIAKKLHKEYAWKIYGSHIDDEDSISNYEEITEWYENGGWCVDEYEAGFMKCIIYDCETENSAETFKFDWSKVSKSWSKWYKQIKYVV